MGYIVVSLKDVYDIINNLKTEIVSEVGHAVTDPGALDDFLNNLNTAVKEANEAARECAARVK